MLAMTIKNKKTGATVHFERPGSHYVYVTIDGGVPFQPCYGGGARGSTLSCATEAAFKRDCRRWYREARSWIEDSHEMRAALAAYVA